MASGREFVGDQQPSAEALDRIETKLDEALRNTKKGWPETVATLGTGALFLGFLAFVLWLVFG